MNAEGYSLPQAQKEADQLTELVNSGQAPDYRGAETLIESQEAAKRVDENEKYYQQRANSEATAIAERLGVSIEGDWEEATRHDAQFAPKCIVKDLEIWRHPSGEFSTMESSFAYLEAGELKKSTGRLSEVVLNGVGSIFTEEKEPGSFLIPRSERTPVEKDLLIKVAELYKQMDELEKSRPRYYGKEYEEWEKDFKQKYPIARQELLQSLTDLEIETSNRRLSAWSESK